MKLLTAQPHLQEGKDEKTMDKKTHCKRVKKYQQKARDAWKRLPKEEQEFLAFRAMKEMMDDGK